MYFYFEFEGEMGRKIYFIPLPVLSLPCLLDQLLVLCLCNVIKIIRECPYFMVANKLMMKKRRFLNEERKKKMTNKLSKNSQIWWLPLFHILPENVSNGCQLSISKKCLLPHRKWVVCVCCSCRNSPWIDEIGKSIRSLSANVDSMHEITESNTMNEE